MRNVLVHEYDEIDLHLVAAALPDAKLVFSAFVEQLATYLLDVDDQR